MPSDLSPSQRRSLVIAVPTYDDWEPLCLMTEALDSALEGLPWHARLLIIDDGSNTDPPRERLGRPRQFLASVEVLTLRRNLGHQRAIATALAWMDASLECEAVIVMDGDGEDSPSDIHRLLLAFDESEGRAVVFAARHRRAEGRTFQFFYYLYRTVHWVLTGIEVRVGNFSVIPRSQLRRLVVVSDLWNHYAAAVFKARLPTVLVPTARAARLGGRPKMNFTQLVVHGLSAISVFGDRVGVRLLLAASVASVVILSSMIVLIVSDAFSGAALSWKLTLAISAAAYLVLNLLVAVTVFVLGLLGSRDSAAFLPARDYHWFIADVFQYWSRDCESVNEADHIRSSQGRS